MSPFEHKFPHLTDLIKNAEQIIQANCYHTFIAADEPDTLTCRTCCKTIKLSPGSRIYRRALADQTLRARARFN